MKKHAERPIEDRIKYRYDVLKVGKLFCAAIRLAEFYHDTDAEYKLRDFLEIMDEYTYFAH